MPSSMQDLCSVTPVAFTQKPSGHEKKKYLEASEITWQVKARVAKTDKLSSVPEDKERTD